MRILYNKNKWVDIYKSPKYESIRGEILTKFKGLEFVEEGHKYFLNGKEMECVSNVAHKFQEHIDTRQLATETFERNFNKPKSKYFQMTENFSHYDKRKDNIYIRSKGSAGYFHRAF